MPPRFAESKKNLPNNFWASLPKPFFALAPMANVTDSVFRKMIAKYGKPDVMWTEFVSADGLNSTGQKKLLIDLKYSEEERPIVVQLFTGHPETMKKAAILAAKLGFDGLDLNMGCPDRAVEKQGGGAALMKNPKLAIKVLEAAREGVSQIQNSKFSIPISIKTRLGYNKVDFDWLRTLLQRRLPALIVHLRTRKEMSDVPAHWELMPAIVKLRDEVSPETLIIGNGDIVSVEEGQIKARASGCDGIMIGRGVFGKPWLFENVNEFRSKSRTSSRARLRQGFGGQGGSDLRLKIMLEHTKLFDKTFCGKKHLKNFAIMKKHFKAYISGWDGARELRVKLMATHSAKEVETAIRRYLR